MCTLFGNGSMTAKALAKGQAPQDPNDPTESGNDGMRLVDDFVGQVLEGWVIQTVHANSLSDSTSETL
jgi:hypothetical protein